MNNRPGALQGRAAGAAGCLTSRPPALCSRHPSGITRPTARGISRPVVAAPASTSPGGQGSDKPQLRPPPQRTRFGTSSAGQAPLPVPNPAANNANNLSSLLASLKRCSKEAKDANQRVQISPAAAAELATLCRDAAVGLQLCGQQLSAIDLADLGKSLSQTSSSMGKHWAPLAPLAEATISAAMQAPAMATADVQDWSPLLCGLCKAGVRTQNLHSIMAYAQVCMTPDVWVACTRRNDAPRGLSTLLWAYATAGDPGNVSALINGVNRALSAGAFESANAQDCSNLVWALASFECSVEQPRTLATVKLIIQAAQRTEMYGGMPQAWCNLVLGLAKMGCRADPNSKCDITPLVASVVSYVQQGGMQQTRRHAIPQNWSNLLWGLATAGCKAAPGSQPDISPLVDGVVQYVQQGGMQQAAPQAWSNTFWAFAALQVPKATAQPVIDSGLPAFRRLAHRGQCKEQHITQVAYALDYYGMPADIQVLLAGLPLGQLTQYQAVVVNPNLKYVYGRA